MKGLNVKFWRRSKMRNEFKYRNHSKQKNEPNLLSEFVEKINMIRRQRNIRIDDFAKRYGLE